MIREFRDPVKKGRRFSRRLRAMEKQCVRCQVTSEERRLRKCVICFRYYCDECLVDRGGRTFCSKQCADFFFFGDEED